MDIRAAVPSSVAGLEPARILGHDVTSASGGGQWGAHQDSSSGAALCHRSGKGREWRMAQKGAAGPGRGGRRDLGSERDM